MNLAEQQCVACRPGAPPVSEQELEDFLSQYPKWEVIEEDGIPQLKRRFRFKDYSQAVSFVNQIAELAQEEDHHPALLLEWGLVTVTWWTHVIRGLHQNDLIMAARTEGAFRQS